MRKRKVRGHNRRHRQIERWKHVNLQIRTDLLEKYQSDHIDIVVHPWCDISLKNSSFPEPRRKTRNIILKALLEIFDNFEKQLIKLNKPFYLAIWLYEPRFTKSQIVYAVEDQIDSYHKAFSKADLKINLDLNNYCKLKERLKKIEWNNFIDEDYFDNETVGRVEDYHKKSDFYETRRWFNKMMKKERRTFKSNELEVYAFTKGNVWVGKRNKNSLQQNL